MSTALATVSKDLAAQSDQLTRLLHAVPHMTREEDVQEVRARIDAARAWARAHKRLKEVRLDLLLLEIRALVRAWELGATTLTGGETETAAEYALLTDEEIRNLVSSFGSATTAAGLMRSVKAKDAEVRKHADEVKEWADAFTTAHPYQKLKFVDSDLGPFEYRYAQGITAVLAQVLDDSEDMDSFTVESIVEGIEDRLEINPLTTDPAIREGLKEVARAAIRKPHIETWNGTKIPRFITTMLPHTEASNVIEYVRLPVMNAKIRDLKVMLGIREEQLAQDKAALKRLHDFYDQLVGECGATADSNIGEIIIGSVEEVAA